ncbi:MAG TPA: YceD family protein [Clostridia bacterium]|nr:YceD family protein [Clostridia bacterium]
MPLLVNLRHLDAHNIELDGELPVEELDIETGDEVIQLAQPLKYELEVQKLEDGLLVQGSLCLIVDCQCVRCLKPFQHKLEMDPWTSHLPLQGEDAVSVNNDCVDLTPYIREDILLELPQHPLCDTECRGLPKTSIGKAKNSSSIGQPEKGSSAWDELNKLKF